MPKRKQVKTLRFYLEVLSIDICVGVLGAGALAQSVFRAAMKPAWWVLLPLSVWVVYTTDHLFDALKVGPDAANQRHRFHHKHMRPLAGLAIVGAVTALLLAVIYLRELVIAGGLVVGALALVHVLLAFWGKVRFGKEISVGLIYTTGVCFAPVLNRGTGISWFELSFLAGLLLAAWLNLFMNSVIEYRVDRTDDQIFVLAKISRVWVRRAVLYVSLAGTLVFAAVTVALAAQSDQLRQPAAYLILALYCAVPGLVLRYERHLAPGGAYRIIAEWVFAVGLIVLLLPVE